MKSTGAKCLLAAVFIARGTSFMFSKQLLDSMVPMNILAVRFLLAFLVLVVVFLKKVIHADFTDIKNGCILGVLYTICMMFEMYGLRLLDSGVSSLIENMAILLVPVYVSILTKTLPKAKTIICALLAVTGVAFLSLTQLENNNGGLGIFLIICAALTYAACIIVTEKVSKNGDSITIGIFQLGTMGVISLIISLCTKSFVLPETQNQWLLIIILALVCSCFGFAFQPVGQKYVSSEEAAVLTVINPLTASIMGIAFAHENLSALKITGYIIILFALLFFNIKIDKKERDKESNPDVKA